MSAITNVSRRGFITGLVGAGALVLSARYIPQPLWAEENNLVGALGKSVLHPDIFLGIETDGTVHIVAHRSEMGTTTRTSLPMVAADELDADWKRVKIEQAIGDPKYGDQSTDGSYSIRAFYDAMRQTGATARTMLVQAAAAQWKFLCQSARRICIPSFTRLADANWVTANWQRLPPSCLCLRKQICSSRTRASGDTSVRAPRVLTSTM
jgi:CO/xanthine dehydrogenase Mo-binding subunit